MGNDKRKVKPSAATPIIDDSVRRDGGKPTDERPVPPLQIDKIRETAKDHTKEEPGS